MKKQIGEWIGKGVLALAGCLGAWLQTEYGVPLWFSILDAVLFCLAVWLALWLYQRRKNDLTEAEKFLLGAMVDNNSAMLLQVFGRPDYIVAGQTEFYGAAEGAVGFAPVAARYVEAYRRLLQRDYLRENENGIASLSASGGKVGMTLPKRYRQRPDDVKNNPQP